MLEQTIPAVIGSVLKVHVPAITFINPDNHKQYCNQSGRSGILFMPDINMRQNVG
jgi:hypothetical protein